MTAATKNVLARIRELLDDRRVSKAEYKEFLEEIWSDVECRLDTRREEDQDRP